MSSDKKVTAIWDFESTWDFPNGYDFASLKGIVETALRLYDPLFVLEKIIAIGPSGTQAEKLIAAGNITFSPIPKENLMCADQGAPTCKRTIARDPTTSKVRKLRTTDTSDIYAIKECYMNALEGKQNILVITNDADFEEMINDLYREKVTIMLARSSCKVLHEAGKVTWNWATMKQGGLYFRKK